MSYRCEACNKTVPHGVPAHRVVTAIAPCVHPYRSKVNRDGTDDKGGNGTRIVSEKTVCGSCAV